MALLTKRDHDAITLLASAAQTVTSTGQAAVRLPGMVQGFVFTLDVTVAATEAADTLDVYVQTKADGTNWVDVQRFTQVLGDGGAKRYYAKITAAIATTEFENATGLGEHSVRNLFGDDWRVRYVITDAGQANDDASFTFSVVACPF